jgi:hypothetical protein
VPALAETQLRLRRAIVGDDAADAVSLLVGGHDPEYRFAIHRRHYESSLVTAIRTKFPATAWLVGSPLLDEAAKRFVRRYPPAAPCIAEYGEKFPRFLSGHLGAARVPYLHPFAELEWRVGQVAISVDQPALDLEDFSRIETNALMDAVLTLQTGLRYLHSSWPVDDLMRLYLSEAAPSEYRLAPADVWLEVCGARGSFQINRLEAAEFVFRKAILDGRSIGTAAEHALDANAAYEVGRAFTMLVTSGHVIAMSLRDQGGKP